MDIISNNELNIDVLSKIFSDAAMEFTKDDDDELYIKGDDVEFPFWVSYSADNEVIKIFTYASMKEGVSRVDALEFVNNANGAIILPSFAIKESDSRFYMYGYYYMPTKFGIDKRALITNSRRFSSAFRFAATLDENDIFFE